MRARIIILAVTIAAISAFMVPGRVIGAEEDALPGEAAVIAAVKTMFADPLSARAVEAQKTVMDFSQGSDKVRVVVARDLGFYPDAGHADTLLAQYIAGVVKYDIENPKQAADERLGIEAGLRAALNAYRKIRKQEPSLVVPGLDEADESIKQGRLNAFIDEALAKAKQERITAK